MKGKQCYHSTLGFDSTKRIKFKFEYEYKINNVTYFGEKTITTLNFIQALNEFTEKTRQKTQVIITKIFKDGVIQEFRKEN